LTRAKAALYAGWIAGAAAVVLAGRFALVAGALFVTAAVLIALATGWGVALEYNDGAMGRPRLEDKKLRFVSVVAYLIAICFVVMGVSLIAGA
jgi:hypothetical protein